MEEAASRTKECAGIQNAGAILKHGYRRRFGRLIAEIEEREGIRGRQKVLRTLQVSFNEFRKAANESAVSDEDYSRYISTVVQKNKEITDSGTIRAGKSVRPNKHFSVAQRLVQKLNPWLDSKLVLSLHKDYAGDRIDIDEAASVLDKLSQQFAAAAERVRKLK